MPRAAEQLQRVRAAYLARSPAAFNQASAEFLATVRSSGPKLGAYPRQQVIDLEVAYNHWAPFRFAWIFTLTACAGDVAGHGHPLESVLRRGLGPLRRRDGGDARRLRHEGGDLRPRPVTNMYESVIYVGLGTALFGLVFELIYRKRYILAAAACVSTLALILADNCPAHLDPSIHPLQPVLRSNFWLVLHVMTITLSYAAFALALGIANITLGYYLVRSEQPRDDRRPEPLHLPSAAGGRALAGRRHDPRRRLGRLLLGPLLGLGSQGGLGADRPAGLPGRAPRPLCQLGRPFRPGGLCRGLLLPGRASPGTA